MSSFNHLFLSVQFPLFLAFSFVLMSSFNHLFLSVQFPLFLLQHLFLSLVVLFILPLKLLFFPFESFLFFSLPVFHPPPLLFKLSSLPVEDLSLLLHFPPSPPFFLLLIHLSTSPSLLLLSHLLVPLSVLPVSIPLSFLPPPFSSFASVLPP